MLGTGYAGERAEHAAWISNPSPGQVRAQDRQPRPAGPGQVSVLRTARPESGGEGPVDLPDQAFDHQLAEEVRAVRRERQAAETG